MSTRICFHRRGGRARWPVIPSLRSRRTRMSDMLLDPFYDLKRDGERPSAVLPRYRNRCPAGHCVHEALELATQWLAPVALERDPLDDCLQRRGRQWHARLEHEPRAQAKELADARREVQTDVPGALEEPDLPLPLHGYPARGQIRHAATLELDPCVGDVRARRQHRHA